jgi:hypothetical protein
LSIPILEGEEAVRDRVETCFLCVQVDCVDAKVPCDEELDVKDTLRRNVVGSGDDGADVCQLPVPAPA